jgi:hypothetical protein
MDIETEILSPKGVWKDFDPSAEPLETTFVKDTIEGNVVIDEYYFTGRQLPDGKSRIYAVVVRPISTRDLRGVGQAFDTANAPGAPEFASPTVPAFAPTAFAAAGSETVSQPESAATQSALTPPEKKAKKHPVVILVADIGRPVDIARLKAWAEMGYIAVGCDYVGEIPDRMRFTLYPKSIEYANFLKSGRHLNFADDGAKQTCYYEWALLHRRALTFIETLPFADAQNVGIIGVRRGCNFLWQIISSDNRLKAAAMLFASDIDTEKNAEFSDERERWLSGVAPQAYVFFVQTPILFLSATNDHSCKMDELYGIMGRIPKDVEKRLSLSPRLNNAIADKQSKNLQVWFNNYLKERGVLYKEPKIGYTVKNKKLFIDVSVDRSEFIKDVRVFYAYDSADPRTRNWWEVSATAAARQKNMFVGRPNILEQNENIAVFANVQYRDGFLLTSNMLEIKQSKEEVEPNLMRGQIVYESSEGISTFFCKNTKSGDEYYAFKNNPVKIVSGPYGIKGVTCLEGSLATYKLGDKVYLKKEDGIILFDIFSEHSQTINIALAADVAALSQKSFKTAVALVGGRNWQKVRLAASDFKFNGKTLLNFFTVTLMYFETTKPIAVNNILLI